MKKLTLAVILLTLIAMTSCRTGYGCHGKSKHITRIKGNGY